MSKPFQSFGFYNPISGKVIDYQKLKKLSGKPDMPNTIGVIDLEHHKKVGSIPFTLALQKYKP